jgi:alginate O-acetyltransferase complex protein AlgI
MLFNSYDFLFFFLPFSLLIYFLANNSQKNAILSILSLAFYGYWNLDFLGILLFSTVINYFLGRQIDLSKDEDSRRNYLYLTVIINLMFLGFFKYVNFFIESFIYIFPKIDVSTVNIVLPVGISFFTFHGMSYCFDIYRHKTQPVHKFVDFVCYIVMFPQLIAGPIVRFNEIANFLILRDHSIEKTANGLRRFIVGLGKKILIADMMAYVVQTQLYSQTPGCLNIWIGMVAFSLQIYFDFAGYSDMAIGLGSIFGFQLPENFNFPYSAKGISDFWRRWHMSLSGWLRDYLYIPLGGSRCSNISWTRNIMVTFLLCGLWHGASWTFVVWGGYFGALIVIERPFRNKIQSLPKWLIIPSTYLFVVVGWVFFKAQTLAESFDWLKLMFSFSVKHYDNLPPISLLLVLLLIQVFCLNCYVNFNKLFTGTIPGDMGILVILIGCLISILGIEVSPFLYYQF